MGSLPLLVACAQAPIAMIPDGYRAVLEHETPSTSGDRHPITIEQLLADAQGTRPAPGASSQVAPMPAAARDTVVLDVGTGALPAEPDRATQARLADAVSRLPPTVVLQARIGIGPAASGDPVSGLARAQNYAQLVAAALPERLQPARLLYRPALPPGAVVVEFVPVVGGADG